MEPERKPEIVDLSQHRKAVQAKEAQAKAATQKAARDRAAASRQGVLGGRKNAGLILLAVAVVLLALYIVPRFI